MQSGPIEEIEVVVVKEVPGDVEEIEVGEALSQAALQHLRRPAHLDIVEPSILIFLLENGLDVACTSNMVGEHFSVQNLQHVHGRIFSHQDQPNEA